LRLADNASTTDSFYKILLGFGPGGASYESGAGFRLKTAWFIWPLQAQVKAACEQREQRGYLSPCS
jgi:hypothetical protein